MLISYAWLRELVPVDAAASEVARRLTARGLTVDGVASEGGDTVFDIDVPANRPDALGHIGIAREVAAAFGRSLAPRPSAPSGRGAPAADEVSVTIEAPELCGRYTARIVRGVHVGPSPEAVVRRLAACGLRSINNVVDVSNLVMLELGQPVHAFDLAALAERAIHVRRARAGETLVTLDGMTRRLDGEIVVIADEERAIALGGVMGGAATEIRDATTEVLIEAAWFAPAAVRHASGVLNLNTDASQRFERGCDPEAPPRAQDLAVRLLAALAGGTPAPGTIDVQPHPRQPRTVSVRLEHAARLLGYAPTKDEARRALAALELAPRDGLGDSLEASIPSWRVDLEREADLVEEIGRHLGYDRIPERKPSGARRRAPDERRPDRDEAVRDRLAALGFHEAFSYAMIGPGEDDPFVVDGAAAPLAIVNPIAETLAVLRRSLLPGLLRAADLNLRRGATEVRLFEVGGVFFARSAGELPLEPTYAGFAWTGAALPAHWSGTSRLVDAWDAAGVIEDLLSSVAEDPPAARERAILAGLHPGQSFVWRDRNGRSVARCGPVHPDLAARLGLPAAVFLGEVDLDLAAGHAPARSTFRPVPRFPGTWRDLSLVIDAGTSAGAILEALARVPAPAPVRMTWIDRYAGRPLQEGSVAMTLRVMLQPLDRTLTDAEVEGYRSGLVSTLDTVSGARLRRMEP